MPEIPQDYKDAQQRADYLILHFWDKVTHCDAEIAFERIIIEQSFSNFLSVFPYSSSPRIISEGFECMLKSFSSNPEALGMINDVAENYLFNIDSPMRNEEYYELYLIALGNAQQTSDVKKARIKDRLELLNKNKIGSNATDFSFYTAEGEYMTLYGTLLKNHSQILLIFFDPDCDNCETTMDRIIKNPEISDKTKSGQLKILAIYAGDNETSWKRKALSLPQTWIIGINKGDLEEEELYFLPEMPTIYLLDSYGIILQRNMYL